MFSSIWVKTHIDELKNFEWQGSDFAFSISLECVGEIMDEMKKLTPFTELIETILKASDMEYKLKNILE